MTSSNLSYAYLIQSLQQAGAPVGDWGYRYWEVSFKTPIIKGNATNKVTYVYGFDNTRLTSAFDGSPYNSTYGGESYSFKDKVQITNPEKTEVADPNNLTQDEKDKIKDEIVKTNPNLPLGTRIEVGNDGFCND